MTIGISRAQCGAMVLVVNGRSLNQLSPVRSPSGDSEGPPNEPDEVMAKDGQGRAQGMLGGDHLRAGQSGLAGHLEARRATASEGPRPRHRPPARPINRPVETRWAGVVGTAE